MWRDRVVAGAVVVLGLLGPVRAEAQCVGCAAGCISINPGYLYCRAVITPAGAGCAAWSICTSMGGDDPIGYRRPNPRTSAVAAAPRLEIYSLTLVSPDAGALFPLGSRASVVHGVSTPFTPATLLAALERDQPGVTSRLRLVEGAVLVGGADFRGAFAADDGHGYALDLASDGAYTRLSVCEIENEQRSGHLATASVASGDVLLVRVALDGHDTVLALTPAGAGPVSPYGTSDPRSSHAEFVRQSNARMLAQRDATIAMHLVETEPGACR